VIALVALVVLGLMAGFAVASTSPDLPDISGSVTTAPTLSEPSSTDEVDSASTPSAADVDSDSDAADEADEDSDEHSTVDSGSVYEREDTDD